ncbi:MAG: caspase family protein [Candidatus Heimdallarchaeota archaeon]|nr:caspase family protein [Candidatus Heimdallarchaeota archaeon]MCK4876259.1 caspase family protein [Candidatus Heimdallarchaeota archaeon]
MKKVKTSVMILILLSSFLIFVEATATPNTRAKPPAHPGNKQVPTVTITNPSKGATVTGSVLITVEASDKEDNPLIADIFIDGIFIIHANSYIWDTTTYTDRTHIISAKAYDSANKKGSDSITVSVDNGSPSPPPPGNYFALIVGISDYGYINDLDYCDDDATDWYNYLNGIGYDNIVVLGDGHTSDYPKYDGLATKANVLTELQNLVANKGAEDTITFIFSGHGAAFDSVQHVICPWDTSATVWDYDIFDYEVASIIGNTNAGKIFMFFDSCNSGGFIPELQADNPVGIMYVTTTCTAKGYGYDEPSYENGAWTYWFLDAGLIQGGSGHLDMEGNFDWAYSYYTHRGRNDRPQEWDEDGSSLFYLT